MTRIERQMHGDVFRSAYLFKDLPADELDPFLEAARFLSYAPDTTVISEGADGGDLYLILSGSVRVTKGIEGGGEHVIGLLRKGDFFGEMALIDNLPRSATVHAHEKADLAVIPRRDIARIFESRPGTAYRVMRSFAEVLSYRLREANDRMRTMAHLERTF